LLLSIRFSDHSSRTQTAAEYNSECLFARLFLRSIYHLFPDFYVKLIKARTTRFSNGLDRRFG
jgi:hypothetical protein